MNPHRPHPVSLTSLFVSILRNRQLIWQMTQREVVGRYRGSFMGLAWSFFNPVLMLSVYTFVFSVIFKARWEVGDGESKFHFAIVLFAGLIVYNLFSEVANRSPSLILENINYVKKVVFPLEILPVISMGAALFHSLISIIVLLTAFVIFNGFLYWSILLAPIVLLPLVVASMGVAWCLASLGAFLRDVSQVISVITKMLLFVSPIFYPIISLPEAFRPWFMLNPLAFIIEQMREVLIAGNQPDWIGWSVYMLAAIVCAWIGYVWFQKTRKGFSDVL
jgi:lipopolysaccharide transport system permease protein